ncbi:MAG: hypothetical protein AAGF12_41115 [Myxococcota bacterium]
MIGALMEHVFLDCMTDVEAAVERGARFTDALVDMVIRELNGNGALIAGVALDPALKLTLTDRRNDYRRRMLEDGLSPPTSSGEMRVFPGRPRLGTSVVNRRRAPAVG